MSITSSDSKADKVLWGKILKIVEESGGREAVTRGLSSVCFKGEHAHLFPEDKRPALRRKWENAKNSSFKHYVNNCKGHGVFPCEATMQGYMKEQEMKQARRAPAPSDSSEEEDDLAEAMQGLDLTEDSPSPAAPMPRRSMSYGSPAPPARARASFSSTRSAASRRSSALEGPFYDNDESFASHGPTSSSKKAPIALYDGGDGSASNPFKWSVDLRAPEMNPVGLLIKRVGIKPSQDTHEHQTWVFTFTALLPDCGSYEMRLVSGRSVLFKKPTYGHMDSTSVTWNELCHDVKDTNLHPYIEIVDEKKADTILELQVSRNPDRQYVHYLLDIPVAQPLDNKILTGGSIDVVIPTEIRKVKSIEYDKVSAVKLTWRIAEEGGVEAEKKKVGVDLKALNEM